MSIEKLSLHDYAHDMLKEYGSRVVLDRAIADYRDGLKPSQRAVLWASYRLGLHYNSPFKKCARTAGTVMGLYHPVGDQSIYNALVGIAGTKRDGVKGWSYKNCNEPLIEGFGNFGDVTGAPAAAMRYTESRLSEFAEKVMLDPDYLAVCEMMPNFSEDDTMPLYLPSKLPFLMIHGSSGIGYGVSGEFPSFDTKGVIELVRRLFIKKGNVEKLTEDDLLECLEFRTHLGGFAVSSDDEILDLFFNGTGTIEFQPTFKVEGSTIKMTSLCTEFTPSKIERFIEEVSQLPNVKYACDVSDKKGFCVEISVNRNHVDSLLAKIEQLSVKKNSYNMSYTIRQKDVKKSTFHRTNILSYLQKWCEYRLDLEVKVIQHLMTKEEAKLRRLHLLTTAIDNLKVIFDSLKVQDSEAHLVKHLKIEIDEAKYILDQPTRRLKSLEKAKLVEQAKECKAVISKLNAELKNPEKRIVSGLKDLEATCF